MIRYASLFSGVGLLDLGFEMALRDLGLGVECVAQVEKDAACRSVLAKHWPSVERHDDVTTFDATRLAVDILVGGFPCQDVSLAGRGRGLAGAKSGLWYEYLRIIQEARPQGIIIENVPGLLRRGLDVVVSGLADAGYSVEATRIQAADVGAPQRRERLFLVAYANRLRELEPGRSLADVGGQPCYGGEPRMADADGTELRLQQGRRVGSGRGDPLLPAGADQTGSMADASRHGSQVRAARHGLHTASGGHEVGAPLGSRRGCGLRREGDQPGLGRVPHGRAAWLDGSRWPAGRGAEPFDWEPPRATATCANRNRRLKQLGNAVVPQCAYVAAHRLADVLHLENLS